MSRKHALVLVGGALALLVLAVGAVLWTPLAWIALGVLQVVVLVVVLDTRRVLSSRVFATTAKLERLITGRSRGATRAAGASSSASAATPGQIPQGEVREVLASRIFDVEWYEAQVDTEFEDASEAVAHYLRRGRKNGFTPHPLFDPAWIYPNAWRSLPEDPLLRYIHDREDAWSLTTSAYFDPARADERLPEGSSGPLAAFLVHRGADYPLPVDPEDENIPAGLTLTGLRGRLLDSTRAWRDREQVLLPARGAETAPEPDESILATRAAFVAEGRAPLVSIILPTWNRARTLREAITSVHAQSYQNWQLVIADDGSIDDTEHVLAAESARDPRIVALRLEHRGVSAARNSALDAATGEYIAFLDSDKVWDPDFLQTMVAVLDAEGPESTEAAYSVTSVTTAGSTVHFPIPASRESLLASNSIDQTALVATREVITRAGGFDVGLRRAVDYDLILSISELTTLRLVPFVGVRYSEDAQDPNRISESQSVAWNYFVRDKHLQRGWTPPEREDGLVTIVIDGVATQKELHAVLDDVRTFAGDVAHEIVVIATTNDWSLVRPLPVTAAASRVPFRIVHGIAGSSAPLRVNEALRGARGEHVLILGGGHRILDADLAGMLERLIDSQAAALHPVVLDGSYLVHDAGVVFDEGNPDPVAFLRGVPREWPQWASPLVPAPAAPWPLLLRTDAAYAVGGMDTRLRTLWADVDLSRRIAASVGPVMVDTASAFQLLRATGYDRSTGAAADVRMIHEEWQIDPPGSRALCDAAMVDATFSGTRAISAPKEPGRWTTAVWRPRPLLSVREGVPQLRWAIKTAAPAHSGSANWGDLHFGQSLAAALRELGQSAVVDYGPNTARATAHLDDVVLTLRGLHPVMLPVGATSVIWVISHPDDVTAQELAGYHLAYGASTTWPAMMRSQWGVDIQPLLQCTDPQRFYVDDPEPGVEDRLLMVGNSRHQYRPAAWHTANAGMPVSIYGTDWDDRVPPETIAGSYIPNEELRRYYRGARWALNDHWSDMREQGFVSNRIFDVLASGGRLLTDDVTGLEDLLPEGLLPQGIATFRSPSELLAIAEGGPEAFYDESSLAAVSDHVREHHSFAARARVMLDDVLRQRAGS